MRTITSPSTGSHLTGAEVLATYGERSYRYPGSPPFRDIAIDRLLFKGRDEESKKVFHSILSSDLFLLYAVSGMGKSSLLNAGVMHRLRSRGYWPVSIRLNDTSASPVQSIERQIVEADLRDTEIEVLRTPGLEFAVTADTTLWDLLGSLEVWRDDRLQQLVIVLDQFEELFTLDWTDDVRRRFISQFGEVVRGHRSLDGAAVPDALAVPVPNVKFCIVIREDALGELDALADDVPQILQNRFRLSALDAAQAEAAIREPAMVSDGALDTQPFRYSEGAAQHILEFLQGTEHAASGTVAESSTVRSVDPSQLQIICQYIERRVLPGKGIVPPGKVVTIEAADLGGDDGLRGVLGDFYRRTIATFPPGIQRFAQHLCEDGLISTSGRRLSLEREQIQTQYAVPSDILHELVDQRLLRVEPRVGSEYYELSHDTLVKPILENRSERRRARSRRRRRFAIVAGAVLALLVLPFLTYRLGFDEGSESVATLELDIPLRATMEQPGSVERFQVSGHERPSIIVVEPAEPEEFDPSVELTNASRARRQSDHLGRGEAEYLVVPAGVGATFDVAVTSSDASTGEFDITASQIDADRLLPIDEGGESTRGSIDEPGTLAVYSVEIAPDPAVDEPGSLMAIEVTSPGQDQLNSAQGGKPGKAEPELDVEIEVIDPSGVGTSFDLESAGNGESAIVGGATGEYLVVIRDYGASTGQFDISAARVIPLSGDDRAEGEVQSTDSVTFAVDVPAGEVVSLRVEPTSDLDPVLEIVHPHAGPASVDSMAGGGAEQALLYPEGQYLVRIHGYLGSVGSFDLVTSPIETRVIAEGEVATATAPHAFLIDVTGGDHVLVVRATSDLDPTIEVVDPNGGPSSVDSSDVGGVEGALLSGDGQYLVNVNGYGDTTGSFEIVSRPAESRTLTEGESVSAASPVVFEVDVGVDELLSFSAVSDTDSLIGIQVNGPDGLTSNFPRASVDPGEPATALIDGESPGLHRIVVASPDPQADITATLESVTTRPLSEGHPVTVGSPVVFTVQVTGAQLYTVTAQPESEDRRVVLEARDPDDLATYGLSSAVGAPAAVTVGGAPGSFEVRVVPLDGPADVTAVLQPVMVQRLERG